MSKKVFESGMNNFEHIQHELKASGVNNPEDPREYDWEGYENKFNEASKNFYIVEKISKAELKPETRDLIDTTREFCLDLSNKFKERFLELLEEYHQQRRAIPSEILNYLKEKKFDLPKFTIAQGEEAGKLLKECGLYSRNCVGDDVLILSFQLPKPLAQFWWKGGAKNWGSRAVDINDNTIEWGYFYRELMLEVWGMQGFYENEKKIGFQRINDIGEHDPKRYYYVWYVFNN